MEVSMLCFLAVMEAAVTLPLLVRLDCSASPA